MYLYVEMWNVTQDWMDLSKEERRKFFDKAENSMKDMMSAGVENLGWFMNDEHTPERSDYRYAAVWKMSTLDDVEKMEDAVRESGWHKFFSQANSRGKVIALAEAIDILVNLEKHSTSILD